MHKPPTIPYYQSLPPHSARVEGGQRLRGALVKRSRHGRPLISIITVVRNAANHLEQTILSVLSQSYDNIEYIIIDGGSTDGTLDIIRSYDDRLAYWISEPDKGIYDAMNKGIAIAKGDLIALLNSKDYYEQSALECVATTCRNGQFYGNSIIYGNYYILDETLQVKTAYQSDLKFWRGMNICHQAMFVSRVIYRTPLFYDTSLRYAADYAFYVDAIRNGVRFIPTNTFLVTFDNSGVTSANAHALSYYREAMLVLRRHFGICSRYLWMFIFIRLIRSLIVTSIKRILAITVSKNSQARLKLFYNKVFKRVSYRI